MDRLAETMMCSPEHTKHRKFKAFKAPMLKVPLPPECVFDLMDIPNDNIYARKAVVIFDGKEQWTSGKFERSYQLYYRIMLPDGTEHKINAIICKGEVSFATDTTELEAYMPIIKEYFDRRLHHLVRMTKEKLK